MDQLTLAGTQLSSRLFLGTAQYPSPDALAKAIEAAQPGLLTVSLRRESAAGKGQKFWEIIKGFNIPVLPNTAGCHSAQEAVTTAEMAREVFGTNWIKLEVIGDDYTLQPDPFALLDAAETLIQKDFTVFPYMTDDLVLAEKLIATGCHILMPWGAPIGSGRGLNNPYALKLLRERFPEITLVVDAGIGAPSHAAAAMEIGYDAVLLNTAVAKAGDPAAMAGAFSKAIEAGRAAYLSGIIAPQESATPSTPLIDKPLWHQGSF
ncbi:MAG: thiazole synthase [Alphaproteobacteria bacterium]|nr:thiazole synthase [Alphaproteobacteria bacterium]MCD8571712.1 thiazole synthase [Alphaproteobacteria bacterium]